MSDTTILLPNESEQTQSAENPSNKKRATAATALGTVGGIVLGAAGVEGYQYFNQEELAAEGVATEAETSSTDSAMTIHGDAPVATVEDTLSFNQAFAAARAQVGPGGVFEWRGQVYGAYYANEWEAMSSEQKQEYYASVGIQSQSEPVETDPSGGAQAQNQPPVSMASNQEEHYIRISDDLVVLGEEVNMGGNNVVAAQVTIDGEQVIVIDVDHNQTPDFLIYDADGDGTIAENEIINLNDYTPQPEPDMIADGPDYTNDANIDYYNA